MDSLRAVERHRLQDGEQVVERARRLIAEAGGGVVEGYPHDTEGKKKSASFLYNGTRHQFEQAGFELVRPKGKTNTVMRTTVQARSRAAAERL